MIFRIASLTRGVLTAVTTPVSDQAGQADGTEAGEGLRVMVQLIPVYVVAALVFVAVVVWAASLWYRGECNRRETRNQPGDEEVGGSEYGSATSQ